MGIQGLLPFLKAYAQKCNIKDFKGKTVGVDAMCWMHKGAFACSQELVLGQDTDKFVHYFLRMCEVLRFNDIKPIIVFDGDHMPAKAKENTMRNDSREIKRTEALALMERRQRGEHVDDRELNSKCEGAIKVTSPMISRLQSALRELSIHFLVAPYEADAQLAYMCRRGWVHAVISEDSDLLAYGCPNTFFKMDKNGDGDRVMLPCLQTDAPVVLLPPAPPEDAAAADEAIDLDEPPIDVEAEEPNENADPNVAVAKAGAKAGRGRGRGRGKRTQAEELLHRRLTNIQNAGQAGPLKCIEAAGKVRGRGNTKAGKKEKDDPGDDSQELEVGKADKDVQLSHIDKWSPEKFIEFCVFCGTDYKEHDVHIKGFGSKTAFKLLCRFASAEIMIRWMVRDKKWKDKLPCSADEYIQRFNSVVVVFWHHLVFDPRSCSVVSISTAFPHTESVRQVLPGLDLKALCGEGAPKELAALIAKGDINPRTRKPQVQEPLTPAERATLDRLLMAKRGEQREHNFQLSLRETAQRIAAAKAAEVAAAVEAAAAEAAAVPEDLSAALPPDASTSGEVPQQPSPQNDAEEEEEAPRIHRSMHLLPGDLKTVMSIVDEVMKGSTSIELDPEVETTPSRTFGSSAASSHASTPAAPPNPFARKREFGMSGDGGNVLAKRLRVSGAVGVAPLPVVSSQKDTSGTSQSTGSTQARQMVAPVNHPRGGFAAKDAVAAVLAQWGAPELAPVEAGKDRSKLTAFFGMKQNPSSGLSAERNGKFGATASSDLPALRFPSFQTQKASPAGAGATAGKSSKPGSALDSWKARPWEVDPAEEDLIDPFTVGRNVLSMKSSGRKFHHVQGWGG